MGEISHKNINNSGCLGWDRWERLLVEIQEVGFSVNTHFESVGMRKGHSGMSDLFGVVIEWNWINESASTSVLFD